MRNGSFDLAIFGEITFSLVEQGEDLPHYISRRLRATDEMGTFVEAKFSGYPSDVYRECRDWMDLVRLTQQDLRGQISRLRETCDSKKGFIPKGRKKDCSSARAGFADDPVFIDLRAMQEDTGVDVEQLLRAIFEREDDRFELD